MREKHFFNKFTRERVNATRSNLYSTVALLLLAVSGLTAGAAQEKKADSVSFTKDVCPVIGKHCLPCHAVDNFNPSELFLDSYESLMAGGKSGISVIPGDSKGSLILKKTGAEPPFGDRMPLNMKKKIQEGTTKWLSEAERKTIADWIDQGAKNN